MKKPTLKTMHATREEREDIAVQRLDAYLLSGILRSQARAISVALVLCAEEGIMGAEEILESFGIRIRDYARRLPTINEETPHE